MTDLPNEILYLILSKINNNQSIFNCRLACKLFYNYFTPLKLYNKGMHIETFVFAEPNVLSYYPSGKIKSEFSVGLLGKSTYNVYNTVGSLVEHTVIKPPHKIKKQTYVMNTIEVLDYNVKTEKQHKNYITNNMNCLVS